MPTAKVAITLERHLLDEVDALVAQHAYPSRSRAIQEAVAEKMRRLTRDRLARECAKLCPAAERQVAEEGMTWEVDEWPQY